MSPNRRPAALAAPLAVLLLAACKSAEPGGCNPTDPLCGGGDPVASVAVASPVDSVMAVGRTASMTAAAKNASGNNVNPQPTFSWFSTNTATATVNPASGLVTALAAGTTIIQATGSGVTGNLSLRAVNANLPAVTTLVGDTLVDVLRQALTASPQAGVNSGLVTCAGHVQTGHVRALDTCLGNLMGVGGANENDNALLNVLDRFFDLARRQLNL